MDTRIAHVIRRITEQLHGKTPFDAYAAEVGLSTSRMGFLFRQATGFSPGAYLQALRMERARILLESTTLSVREVMEQVGLGDPSHFARDFRNTHGLSPRTYRLQLRLAGPPSWHSPTTERARAFAQAAAEFRVDPPAGPLAAPVAAGPSKATTTGEP